MDEDIFPELCVLNPRKTYTKSFKSLLRTSPKLDNTKKVNKSVDSEPKPLTTKTAVEYLLSGKLNTEVCRYCLLITPGLAELDQIMQFAGTGTLYKVSIRQMIACFFPFKENQDQNLPEKICQKCLDRAINAYLFTQQIEQAERALHNCFEDIYEKLDKLDPIDGPKKRGRQKLNPNHNMLHAEHKKVMDYAEPIRNLINIEAESVSKEPDWNELECKKCWQVLPSLETLINHEKIHPKNMWYNCRLCGKSFIKFNQLRKHYNYEHIKGKVVAAEVDTGFKCNECGDYTDSYIQHLQHIEKHKFKSVMKHVIEKKTDKLCTICLNKCSDLVELDKMVCLHGGYPELSGDKTLYSVLASTLPNMNNHNNFVGTKICEKCLNNVISSYIFINQFIISRERLDLCISHMLHNLENITPHTNVFVQISQQTIMPSLDIVDETLLLGEDDYLDESKLKVDVLEDEFRVKTDSDSDTENKIDLDFRDTSSPLTEDGFYPNAAKHVKTTYVNKKLVNGYQKPKFHPVDVCSEFLTFNKKKKVKKNLRKFTCPKCNKHFVSEYFLKRHILKHVYKKVKCNICEDVFNSKFYLYEHTKMTHLLQLSSYMSCKDCGRTFTNETKLHIHEKHHRYKPCELCNKTYITQKHYDNHIQRHSVKLKIIKQKCVQTCSFCEKECSNDNELSLHVNKIHLQIKPYNCDMCEKQFYTENNLKSHKKLHSIPTKETCQFCNKILKSRKKLVIHVRKHIGV